MLDTYISVMTSDPGIIAIAVALVSGGIAGFGLTIFHRYTNRAGRRAVLTAGVVLWVGALYFVSITAALIVAGVGVNATLLSLATVWIVFSGSVGVTSYAVLRQRRSPK